MKKKVFLYAYDKVNLGDDLFIRTIVNRYPAVKFFLWSNKENKKVFEDCKNLFVVNRDSKFNQFLKWLRPSFSVRYQERLKRKCDAVVYIGGSIFMEYPSWKNIIQWWNYQSLHHQFYVIGANFGPYQSEEYRNAMSKIFKQMKDICFRDSYSKNLFLNVPAVRCAPDILFSYKMYYKSQVQKQVFVSVISYRKKEMSSDFDQMTHEEYIIRMAEITETYIKNGWKVILASFCEQEGDLDAIKEIISKYCDVKSKENVKVMSYNGKNYKQVTEAIINSRYIISARFHGVILAMVAGKAVFPILYSDKIKYVLDDIDFKGRYADLRKPETLTYKNSKENFDKDYKLDIQRFKIRSEDHFKKLDEYLK